MEDSWGRDTPWYQGAMIKRELISCEVEGNATHLLAISHSCDIPHAENNEPNILFIPCSSASNPYPSLSHGKNPRKIHLDVLDGESSVVFALNHAELVLISKRTLLDLDVEPDPSFSLSPNALFILQDWLACRYRRQAFPDNLDIRLRKIKAALIKTGKRHSNSIVGYWLDYDPRDQADHPGPYELRFYVVYDANTADAEGNAIELVEVIEGVFSEDEITQMITLVECVAVASADFPYEVAMNTMSFRLDYLSHRVES